MKDNPKYAGDYISQAKVEINMFNILLDEKLKQKTDNHEFKLIQEFNYEIPEYPEYSFYHFKKFADEKLSSTYPDIYIDDLDKMYIIVDACITKYCKLIEKTVSETELFFMSFSLGDRRSLELKSFIYLPQANFCFCFKTYYKTKRKLVIKNKSDHPNVKELDYQSDEDTIKKIFADDFRSVIDDDIKILISHILYYKHGGEDLKKLPDILLIGVSQRKLIRICKKIIETFNWDSGGRHHLANIFGQLIRKHENYKPIKYNSEVILKGMY